MTELTSHVLTHSASLLLLSKCCTINIMLHRTAHSEVSRNMEYRLLVKVKVWLASADGRLKGMGLSQPFPESATDWTLDLEHAKHVSQHWTELTTVNNNNRLFALFIYFYIYIYIHITNSYCIDFIAVGLLDFLDNNSPILFCPYFN